MEITLNSYVLTKLGSDQVSLWSRKGKNTPMIIFADLNLLQVRNIINKLSKTKLSQYQIINIQNLELIKTLIEEGSGIGILPDRIAKMNSKLKYFDKSLPTFKDNIFLVYRFDMMKEKVAKKIIKISKSILN